MASMKPGHIEPPPPIASLSNTSWTQPSYAIPIPSLTFAFHLECDMEPIRDIGHGPHGNRKVVMFRGGRFEGPKIRGEVMPGGGDWMIVRNHGETDQLQTAHLNTRYNLVTHDGATIYAQTTGTRTGKRELLERLSKEEGADITADQFKMRLHITLETGDPRYEWVNDAVFVASAGRIGNQVIYDAYELL
ncbi:hypothetical protein QQS21_002637 [Conoideocrella luteorostrata]|uniref:Uncharacterized protein n=1 Tax=Conoideocrella luteorostrata TaxID=1105319 RepID=A0AAJ0G123_9HYPO|nr:hypothetical protein QQS21_002637 [Conoideocrella luteorostrata]